MRAPSLLALVVLVLTGPSASARADDAPVVLPAAGPVPALPVAAPPVDASPRTAYDTLFDVGFQALSEGKLILAEEAFLQAAALPGDPVRSSVAASFAERVIHLRATRRKTDRHSAAAAVAAVAPPAASPDDGPRTALIVTSSLIGIGLYGWTLPAALGLTTNGDASWFVGTYLLAASASVVIPYVATRKVAVTPGQANLAFYGGTRGAWHGALLSAAIFGNVSADRRYQLWAGSLLAGSVAELGGGYFFARSADLSAGDARTIALGGDFGMGWGLAVGALLGLHHDNHSEDAQARGMASMGLLGATLGLGGGYFWSQRRDNSWGDGEVLRAAGLLGTGLGLGVGAFFGWTPEEADQKKFFSTLIIGGAAGLWLGDRLVQNTEFTVGESVLVDLATVVGGLAGAGIAYLAKGDDPQGLSARAYGGAAAMGGALGFGLAYLNLRKAALHRAILEENVATRASTIAVLPLIGKKGEQGLSVAGTF